MRTGKRDPYLRLALQTVLFRHRHELHEAVGSNGHDLIDRMTQEIESLAGKFETATHNVTKGQENHAPLSFHRFAD